MILGMNNRAIRAGCSNGAILLVLVSHNSVSLAYSPKPYGGPFWAVRCGMTPSGMLVSSSDFAEYLFHALFGR